MPGDESYSAGGGTGWEEVGGGGRRWDYGQPVGAMPLLAASVSQRCEGCVVSAGGTRVLSRETTCQRLWRSAVGWVRMPAAPHCTMCASRSPRCPLPQAACSLLHRCGAYAERFRPTGAHTRGQLSGLRLGLRTQVHTSNHRI